MKTKKLNQEDRETLLELMKKRPRSIGLQEEIKPPPKKYAIDSVGAAQW
jgi:hypothetical protein